MEKQKTIKILVYQILCKKGNIFTKEIFIDKNKFKDALVCLVECGFDCQCKTITKEVIC